MKRWRIVLSSLMLLVALDLGQSRADIVVAGWSNFNSPSGTQYLAETGSQAGSATAEAVNAKTVSVVSGELNVEAEAHSWNSDTAFKLLLSGAALQDFKLDYDIRRLNGPGANEAPTVIGWYANGGAIVVDSFTWSTTTTEHHQVDFSSVTALNNNPSVLLEARFAGASGGNVSSLVFDNVNVSAVAAVPEASSFLSVGAIGLASFGWRRWRTCQLRA